VLGSNNPVSYHCPLAPASANKVLTNGFASTSVALTATSLLSTPSVYRDTLYPYTKEADSGAQRQQSNLSMITEPHLAEVGFKPIHMFQSLCYYHFPESITWNLAFPKT
jgi:hypothetical protein